MRQRIPMRADEIADMDIIANAGAVRRRVIGTEDFKHRTQAQRRFGCDLDQVRGGPRRLPGAAMRVGAGNVK